MSDPTLHFLKERAVSARTEATLRQLYTTMVRTGISIEQLLDYYEAQGTAVTDLQKMVDYRKRTANSNAQLKNLELAREVKAAKHAEATTKPEPPAAPEITLVL